MVDSSEIALSARFLYQLSSAALPIRDTTRTRVPVPTTKPVAQVDTSQRLQHTISWRDESSPTAKAKPPGVRGAEIWLFIGPTPPSDPAQARTSSRWTRRVLTCSSTTRPTPARSRIYGIEANESLPPFAMRAMLRSGEYE